MLGSLAAWALVGIVTAVLVLASQSSPRAFANACLIVAGVFACGVFFRFGASVLRSSRALTGQPKPGDESESRRLPEPGSRAARYGILPPPRHDRASLAFAVLATLVMIQVLVLGFVVGTKA